MTDGKAVMAPAKPSSTARRLALRARLAVRATPAHLQTAPERTARVLAHYAFVIVCVLLAMYLRHTVAGASALSEHASRVQAKVLALGTAYLTGWMIWRAVWTFAEGDGLHALLRGMLSRAALFWLALEAIPAGGAAVTAWIGSLAAQPPEVLAVTSTAIACVWAMLWLVPQWLEAFTRTASSAVQSGAHFMAGRRRHRPDREERFRIAIHEAGHVLPHALLPLLPPVLIATVFGEFFARDAVRGKVESDGAWAEAQTESAMRIRMLVGLGGPVAERLVYGEGTDGSIADYDDWTRRAHLYLCAGFGEVFYAQPTDDHQRTHNRAVLNGLKAQQEAALEALFLQNRALLDELARALVDAGALERDALGAYLVRVQLTPGLTPRTAKRPSRTVGRAVLPATPSALREVREARDRREARVVS